MDSNQISKNEEIDFSHYLDEHILLGATSPAETQSDWRFSIKQIAVAGIIIVLAGVLLWLLWTGGQRPAVFKVPSGYRLVSPGLVSPENGPPRLEKIK